MKIKEKGVMQNGTHIQLEDWSENYSVAKGCTTLGTYPTAERSLKGAFMPKAGEKFRASFNFDSEAAAKAAFESLINSTDDLTDFVAQLANPKYAAALGVQE